MTALKPYPGYEPTPGQWVSKIPKGWEWKKFKHIGEAIIGLTYAPDDVDDDGTVVLRSTNIQGGKITLEQVVRVRKKIPEKLVTKRGDILICSRNGSRSLIGKNALIDEIGCGESFGAFTTVFRSESNNYLYWVFNSDLFDFQAGAFMTTTVNQLTSGMLNNFVSPFPPEGERLVICQFLECETARIDKLIAEKQNFINLLKEKRQALISHVVTKGLDPKAKMKDSGIEWIGEVPEHWIVKKIKHSVISLNQGWSPQCENSTVASDEEWGVLKVGCVNGGVFSPKENKKLPDELEPVPELSLMKGDLLVSRANAREWVGSAAVVHQDYPKLMLCDKIYRIRLDEKAANPDFISFYLGSSKVREQIEIAATGTSSSMLNIGQKTILTLPIAQPPIDEQVAIVDAVKSATSNIDKLASEVLISIELLKEHRTALISAAVTGKIDVREQQ